MAYIDSEKLKEEIKNKRRGVKSMAVSRFSVSRRVSVIRLEGVRRAPRGSSD